MPKQHLNDAHVLTGFQQVRGERVTQSSDGNGLLHAGSDAKSLTHLSDAMPTNRLFAVLTRKEPTARSLLLPILSQYLEQSGREHHVAILLSLALPDADHHALRVDVR